MLTDMHPSPGRAASKSAPHVNHGASFDPALPEAALPDPALPEAARSAGGRAAPDGRPRIIVRAWFSGHGFPPPFSLARELAAAQASIKPPPQKPRKRGGRGLSRFSATWLVLESLPVGKANAMTAAEVEAICGAMLEAEIPVHKILCRLYKAGRAGRCGEKMHFRYFKFPN
ncbi:MAG: hypothetical protein LBQ81_09720 [Zoogloeaceae bacterium]|jgi:hypothetical protein|nr:hypothetical protein [Zoogloeaceae bacterium]